MSRPTHTQLNRLVLTRLPLALPPHTHNPELFTVGLLHFAPIYITFEAFWKEYLSSSSCNGGTTKDNRVAAILQRLYIHSLLRTAPLEKDLAMLSSYNHRLNATLMHRIQAFDKRLHLQLTTEPLVLIAYAWVMYMALFNGGRWMRAQIEDAGAFWDVLQESASEAKIDRNLSVPSNLFHFEGVLDGEDIKDEFKLRLAEVEQFLTNKERQDIVNEARYLFEHCVLLVEDLDRLVAAGTALEPCQMPMSILLLQNILPMGLLDLFGVVGQYFGLGTRYEQVPVVPSSDGERGLAQRKENK